MTHFMTLCLTQSIFTEQGRLEKLEGLVQYVVVSCVTNNTYKPLLMMITYEKSQFNIILIHPPTAAITRAYFFLASRNLIKNSCEVVCKAGESLALNNGSYYRYIWEIDTFLYERNRWKSFITNFGAYSSVTA